ncbi:MAG: alpha/beta fold hydrolase [Thermodesulfobacteriota bacterium]
MLIIAAARDSLVDIGTVRKRASKIPNCQLEVLECGHFDVYAGPLFEANLSFQEAFLKNQMR